MEKSKKVLEIDKEIEEYTKNNNPEYWERVKNKCLKDFNREELLEFMDYFFGFTDKIQAKKHQKETNEESK